MNRILLVAAIFSISAVSYADDDHKGWTEAARSAVDEDGVVRRGEGLPKLPAIGVDDCAARSKKLDGEDIVVAGRVTSVCQAKGCWLVMTGDESDALIRVMFKGYKHFVPKDIAGRRARVAGTLKVKRLSRRAAQHFEDDAAAATGRKARKIKKGRVELTLMADALSIEPANAQ